MNALHGNNNYVTTKSLFQSGKYVPNLVNLLKHSMGIRILSSNQKRQAQSVLKTRFGLGRSQQVKNLQDTPGPNGLKIDHQDVATLIIFRITLNVVNISS